MKKLTFIGFLVILSFSCTNKLPQNAQNINRKPVIYPDYTNTVIPNNIAPLNFNIKDDADDYITVASSQKGESLQSDGKKVQWDMDQWRQLLSANKGNTLYIDIYAKKGEQWYKYQTITNRIAPDAIDSYISYRLIEPSYELYEYMTINQRNITSFDEKVIYNNSLGAHDEEGQCINCHSYQDYNRGGKMQFHIRQNKGGTLFISPEGVKKVNLKTENLISAGVYPAWHPKLNVIAYSVNKTEQHFHKKSKEKVEVMDSKSDLILYDLKKNEVRFIANDSNALETFPAWSPDGRYLYYTSARYPEGTGSKDSLINNYTKYHYNIYRKSFNLKTLEFGAAEMIFDASAINKSASLPRISPNGKYLLFTLGDYGNFHIWHKSSDLYLIDLKTGAASNIRELNSPNTESYHSWSSNGSWIIFSSRRDDGSYTRPYIAYFKNGKAHKPFLLPQKDPDYYGALLKSFNIPEFMVKPASVSQRQLIQAIDKNPENASFKKTK